MAKSIEDLRAAIKSKLASLVSAWPVYSEMTPQDTALPRVVFFLFGNGAGGQCIEDFILTVELHTKDTSTAVLDSKSEAIRGNGDPFLPTGLDKHILAPNGAGVRAVAFYESRSDEITNEAALRQRNLAFRLKVFYD